MAVAVSWFKSASLPPGPVKGSLNITPKNAWGCLLKDKSEDNDPKDGWKSPKEWWQKESWRVLDGNPVEMQWGDLKCLKRSSVGKLLHGRESKYFSQSLSETIIGNISTSCFCQKGAEAEFVLTPLPKMKMIFLFFVFVQLHHLFIYIESFSSHWVLMSTYV